MSNNIIQLNEDFITHDLKDLVRSGVDETLNALLDKEADELANAQKYERSSDRQGYRSGLYKKRSGMYPSLLPPASAMTDAVKSLVQRGYERG